MSQTEPTFKPKKSVALSGTPAGNTSLCTVGHNGNDLHYRGYDIHDLARHCEFEEVAWLLIHGKLPNTVELTAYKTTLPNPRSLPLPSSRHSSSFRPPPIPWTCSAPASPCSAASALKPADHNEEGARGNRRPPPRLPRLHAPLLAPLRPQRPTHRGRIRRRIHRRALPASAARRAPLRRVGRRHAGLAHSLRRARIQRLHLHRARHRRHRLRPLLRITGAIGALKGPKHGGANEVALEIQNRYAIT